MLKKRILCLVLCFSVFVSCAFYKPRQAYAFAATATVAGLALTLAAACGITFSVADSGLIDDGINEFLKSNPEHEAFLSELISLKLDPVSGAVSIGLEYKDQVLSFLNSLLNYFSSDSSGSGVVQIPSQVSGFNISNDLISYQDYVPNTLINSSYYISSARRDGSDSSPLSVTFFNGENLVSYSYNFDTSSWKSGNTSLVRNFDSSLPYGFRASGSTSNHLYFCYNINGDSYSSTNTYSYFTTGSSNISVFRAYNGVTYYRGDYATDLFNTVDFSLLDSLPEKPYDSTFDTVLDLPYIYVYPPDVTADTVITGWTNAFEQSNEDVIIYPLSPDELVGVNGYDVAYGYEGVAGAVEGVDLPQGAVENPDIPVTPDLSGITGLLNKILSFLKSIPAALIGTKALDFSGFSNISLFDKFPFCIPFDLVNAVNQLNAPPEAPVFKVDFKGTIMESAGSIEIDMSNFEQLAKILRFFEFFGFVAGLIVVTRNLIRG